MRRSILAILIIMLVALGARGLFADSQWPSQMNVGGFNITGIRGNSNADGSGNANGTIQVPGFGNSSISLNRSSRGDVTGNTSISGGGIQGGFSLNSSGLRGRGSVNCFSRSITDASISISSNGQANGNGRMSIGRAAMSVDFTVSGSSSNVGGSAPARSQVDTPVASYKFDGRLNVQGNGGRISTTVSGRVERRGKLANQVSTYNISNTSVDTSNGQCTVNCGGVSVTFQLF